MGGAPPPGWFRALPAAVCLAEPVSPEPLDIGFVLGAVPPPAVLSCGPAATALLGAPTAVVVPATPVFRPDDPGSTDVLTVRFVAALSVPLSCVRTRRDARLTTERAVARAVQRAVAPPLPEGVGPVRCGAVRGPVPGRAARHPGRRRLLRRARGSARHTGGTAYGR
ncbi:hypothetical protein ACIF8T_28145 [Streptomyces sp. NPDC085946]|uniref:hypothetical protein n=1 Tax=Streptomyces sp. NPDC085946 TaxID=3365744 RepID=UPI0037D0F81F